MPAAKTATEYTIGVASDGRYYRPDCSCGWASVRRFRRLDDADKRAMAHWRIEHAPRDNAPAPAVQA